MRKVHYRHHPLYGQEVEVVRRSHRVGESNLIVRLPDDSWCAVPQWMFEESICAGLLDAPGPLLSVSALRSLIRLLDSQREQGACSGHENKPSSNAGGNLTGSLPTNIAAPGVKRGDFTANGPAVSAADGPDAHRDRSRGKKGAGR
jgi:hypothetical protein